MELLYFVLAIMIVANVVMYFRVRQNEKDTERLLNVVEKTYYLIREVESKIQEKTTKNDD